MATSTISEFKTLLSNLLKARFPYLYISTWEEERALSVIESVVKDEALIKTPRKLFIWSITKGMAEWGKKGTEETKVPMNALQFIENFDEPAVFVMKDFHIFFGAQHSRPDHQVIRKIRDLLPLLKRSRNPKNVIFVSPILAIPNELQKDVTIIDFDLPTFQEIKNVLKEMVIANRNSGRMLQVTDLLIDGPFRKDLLDTSRPWVGSLNQRYYFLTSRYKHLEKTLKNVPNRLEIRIHSDGRVFVNGLATTDHMNDLFKDLYEFD
ncbi:4Fe-4S cluster-binding domain-containing protein [Thermolongibacillus altinsuensis]